jgi:hypothetical protein
MSGVLIEQNANLHTDRSDQMRRGDTTPGASTFEGGGQPRIRRAPVRAIAAFTPGFGGGERFGQVLNLSPGGCLLRTETTLEPGDTLALTVTLVGARQRVKVDLRAVVRRVEAELGRRAYGVEFLSDERAERESAQWLYARAMSG